MSVITIIVVGIDEETVYLHDPEQASGPQTMTYKEFAVYWVDQIIPMLSLDWMNSEPQC